MFYIFYAVLCSDFLSYSGAYLVLRLSSSSRYIDSSYQPKGDLTSIGGTDVYVTGKSRDATEAVILFPDVVSTFSACHILFDMCLLFTSWPTEG